MNQKVIQLLVEIFAIADNDEPDDEPLCSFPKIKKLAGQALNILGPQPDEIYDDKGNFLMEIDSKQQPAAGEFTENLRKFVKLYKNEIPRRAEITFLEEACDIIDRAEATNKDLRDNLEMLVALLCHPGSFVSAKDIENAKAAIAK